MSNKNNEPKPSYVNRVGEIEKVKKKLNTIRLGKVAFDSILEWYGIPGIGKTTLSRKAVRTLCGEMDIDFSYINFDPDENKKAGGYASDPTILLEDIIINIGKHMPSELKASLDAYRKRGDKFSSEDLIEEVVRKFLEYVKVLIDSDPVVFGFDSTDKIEPEAARWIENDLVRPLCKTGRCLIIWTGRFPTKWKQFEVRRRTVTEKLEPLPPKETSAQLKLIGNKDKRINAHRYTSGHPRANEGLFKAISDFESEKRSYDEKDIITAVNKVIEEYVMQDMPEKQKEACRILSVFRQFDVAILTIILPGFLSNDYKESGNFMKVIEDLEKKSIVEWDPVRKGYTLDSTIRHILALKTKLTQEERYIKINENAERIYEEWIDKVRENRSIYILEKLYHHASIGECSQTDKRKISTELQDQLAGYLDEYYRHDELEFAYSATDRLARELEKDDGLEKILGEKGFEDLKKTIISHRLMLEKG